jgi:hypothetical protein
MEVENTYDQLVEIDEEVYGNNEKIISSIDHDLMVSEIG